MDIAPFPPCCLLLLVVADPESPIDGNALLPFLPPPVAPRSPGGVGSAPSLRADAFGDFVCDGGNKKDKSTLPGADGLVKFWNDCRLDKDCCDDCRSSDCVLVNCLEFRKKSLMEADDEPPAMPPPPPAVASRLRLLWRLDCIIFEMLEDDFVVTILVGSFFMPLLESNLENSAELDRFVEPPHVAFCWPPLPPLPESSTAARRDRLL
mmetsp:Transcript_5013/g.14615  ORF Transcript_5013/g.14615 Transcript_5013/m.14615 type:complete len:208 (-) Transcript_5013:1380-2003(-)